MEQALQIHRMIPCNRTHGSWQRINNRSIQEEYKIWVLVTEVYSYVVQIRPYEGAKKGKQVASSTKWGLGENFVMWLMECLTSAFSFDIFVDNYFTCFRLLTHLGVNNFRATVVLNKKRLWKCTIIGDKQLQKKWTWPFWTAHIKQKCSVTLTVIS